MCPSELLAGQTGTRKTHTLSSCQILPTAFTKLAHLDQHSHNSTWFFQDSTRRRSRYFFVAFKSRFHDLSLREPGKNNGYDTECQKH